MSNGELDDEFWDLADKVVDIANSHCSEMGAGKVSSALLYGVARFNAFIVASTPSADIPSEKEAALDYFTSQYRKKLSENLDDFHKSGEYKD